MAIRRLLCCLVLIAASVEVHSQERIQIKGEGGIRDAWTLAPGAKLPVPAYPAAYADKQSEACVAIGYLLNADGTTSDFALLKSWSAAEPRRAREAYWAAFAQDASRALALWKFAPKADVQAPKPVYTSATFLFASANAAELRKRCAIPNLPMHLVELRRQAKVRRRMAGLDIFDRLDIDPALEQRIREEERVRDVGLRPTQEEVKPPPKPTPEGDGGGGG